MKSRPSAPLHFLAGFRGRLRDPEALRAALRARVPVEAARVLCLGLRRGATLAGWASRWASPFASPSAAGASRGGCSGSAEGAARGG